MEQSSAKHTQKPRDSVHTEMHAAFSTIINQTKPGYCVKLRRESDGPAFAYGYGGASLVADAKKNKKLDRRHIVNISRTNFLLFHSRCGYSGARSRMFDAISGLTLPWIPHLASAFGSDGFRMTGPSRDFHVHTTYTLLVDDLR